MIPRVVDARYVEGFVIHITFEDGVQGPVDLRDELWGPVFEPLKDPDVFRKFAVHPELDTVTWENGADFAPEFLYEAVKKVSA